MTARVYVNLPEGNYKGYQKIPNHHPLQKDHMFFLGFQKQKHLFRNPVRLKTILCLCRGTLSGLGHSFVVFF